jgi:GNAT superfamily N-acetyltransferase
MSVEIRRAAADDLDRARRFYLGRGYGGGIRPEDTVLLAEQDGQLAGIVRLAREHGAVVLRGMQVDPAFQRRRIGTRLLAVIADELGERDCYCIPYAHLVEFYGQIGFRPIEPDDAPAFLAERIEEYRGRANGKEYLLMHRPGRSAPAGTPREDA